jgi:hypothetical protein
MKIKHLLLLLLSIPTSKGFCQFHGIVGQDTTISFANRDYMGSFHILPNGNTLIAARAERTSGTGGGNVNKHGAFIEITPSGQVVQQRRLGFRSLNAMYQHPDGNYIVTGEGSGFACTSGMCKSDVLVAKVTPQGSTIWARSFGNTVYNGSDGGRGLLGLTNGDILLLGNVYEANNRSNALVVRLNSNGDTLWVRSPGASSNQFAYCATEGTNGNLYVGIGGTGGIQVICFTSAGSILWGKQYSGFGQASQLKVLPNGNILVAAHGLISPNYHWFLIEINPVNGNVVRGNTYLLEDTENRVNYVRDAIVLANGDVVMAGYGFRTTTTDNENRALICRFSPSGEIRWARTYHQKNSIIEKLKWHNGRIEVGMSLRTTSQVNTPDLGLFALNPDGENDCFEPVNFEVSPLPQAAANRTYYSFNGVETGTSTPGVSSLSFWTFQTCSAPQLEINEESVVSTFQIYADNSTIHFNNIPENSGKWNICDISGRTIGVFYIYTDSFAYSRQGIPSGIYIVRNMMRPERILKVVLP